MVFKFLNVINYETFLYFSIRPFPHFPNFPSQHVGKIIIFDHKPQV